MRRVHVATAVIAAALGFGAGALVFRPEVSASRPVAPEVAPIVRVVERERVVERLVAQPAVRAPPPLDVIAKTPVDAGPRDALALEARVQDLERQLAVEHQLRVGAEGEHVAAPAALPARFRDEKQLLETFNTALKAAGFADAQVENIDCTEHPCIVYSRGFGEREDMERLKPFLGSYREDGLSTFGFANGEGSKVKRFFGVAVMPGADEDNDALLRRLNFRVQQMYEVSKPAR